MKLILVLIGLLSLLGVFLFQDKSLIKNLELSEQQSSLDQDIMQEYVEWKQKYNKNTNQQDDSYRFSQFKENYLLILEHNSQENVSFTLGLNQFAAMSNKEYQQTMLNLQRPSRQQKLSNAKEFPAKGSSLPDSIDWSKKGAVFPTQNQGSCGSCWAFATIGGLQGLRAIVDGKLELLSAQQITSCVPKEYLDDKTQGCGGGLPQYAYQYTSKDGIELASSYPYTDADAKVASPCQYNKKKAVFYNDGVGFVPQQNTQAMKENLVNQPLSIGIDASSIYFQLYSTGVINTNNCGTSINHSILMVGYDSVASDPYWIVQNSWGTDWGNKGFGKIGISEGQGYCMINMEVDFPTSVNQKPTQQKSKTIYE